MVTILDGRFAFPSKFFYNRQHVYLNREKKLIGLDELGVEFLKSPSDLQIVVEPGNAIKIGEPIAIITTERGTSTLFSPCTGQVKSINPNSLQYIATDTYGRGYFVEMEAISEIDSDLISGAEVENWALSEARSLIRNSYTFKIIEIGDSATGKTALKVRFTDNYFKRDLKTTLGVDFGSRVVECEYLPEDIMFSGPCKFKATLNIWDAAGQAHYDRIRGMYYRDAKGAILVYDITNRVSFQNLDRWISELEDNLGRKIPVLLVGNKTDLEHTLRKVSREDGQKFADSHGFLFTECSAKTGDNVTPGFIDLALALYKSEENLT